VDPGTLYALALAASRLPQQDQILLAPRLIALAKMYTVAIPFLSAATVPLNLHSMGSFLQTPLFQNNAVVSSEDYSDLTKSIVDAWENYLINPTTLQKKPPEDFLRCLDALKPLIYDPMGIRDVDEKTSRSINLNLTLLAQKMTDLPSRVVPATSNAMNALEAMQEDALKTK
jgi:hypothetical protein